MVNNMTEEQLDKFSEQYLNGPFLKILSGYLGAGLVGAVGGVTLVYSLGLDRNSRWTWAIIIPLSLVGWLGARWLYDKLRDRFMHTITNCVCGHRSSKHTEVSRYGGSFACRDCGCGVYKPNA